MMYAGHPLILIAHNKAPTVQMCWKSAFAPNNKYFYLRCVGDVVSHTVVFELTEDLYPKYAI